MTDGFSRDETKNVLPARRVATKRVGNFIPEVPIRSHSHSSYVPHRANFDVPTHACNDSRTELLFSLVQKRQSRVTNLHCVLSAVCPPCTFDFFCLRVMSRHAANVLSGLVSLFNTGRWRFWLMGARFDSISLSKARSAKAQSFLLYIVIALGFFDLRPSVFVFLPLPNPRLFR